MSAIQVHDMALCRPLLAEAPVLRAGDLLLEDRGFLDGATVSDLKRKRRVDVIIPLKANMLATQEAMQLARFGKFHSPRKVDNSVLGRASAYRHCCALSHKSPILP